MIHNQGKGESECGNWQPHLELHTIGTLFHTQKIIFFLFCQIIKTEEGFCVHFSKFDGFFFFGGSGMVVVSKRKCVLFDKGFKILQVILLIEYVIYNLVTYDLERPIESFFVS
jgi:hypothetical protein